MQKIKLFLSVLAVGLSGLSDASAVVKDLGALHSLAREVTIDWADCAKTWKKNFDQQAECRVSLWPTDPAEVMLQPIVLLGVWNYTDDDFKATVTVNRDVAGYLVRLDINDKKFMDRLDPRIARKYVEKAVKDKKFEKFETLIARPSGAAKSGAAFKETYKNKLHVVQRTVSLARGREFYEVCRKGWNGFQCSINLIRNTRGESLLTDTMPARFKSGILTLQLNSVPAWRDGTAFSVLTISVSATRHVADLSALPAYDDLVRQFPSFSYLTTQIMGDDLEVAKAAYAQKFQGEAHAVTESFTFNKAACQATYAYQQGKFKGRCEVAATLPGVIAQTPLILSQFFTVGTVSSFVQFAVTQKGWRADFTGDENAAGKFANIEVLFDEAVKTLQTRGSEKLFLSY